MNDTNCGIGMYRDSNEDKYIEKLEQKIKRALEIINRPYPELTNVDKVAMVKRILEG